MIHQTTIVTFYPTFRFYFQYGHSTSKHYCTKPFDLKPYIGFPNVSITIGSNWIVFPKFVDNLGSLWID